MEEKDLEKILERLTNIETSVQAKNKEIEDLKTDNANLKTQLANLKLDKLTRDVSQDEVKEEPVEDITFDFDIN